MGIWKKDQLQKCDNELDKLRQERLRLNKRLKELDDLESNILNNRKDIGIKKYLNAEKRRHLLDEAEKLGFSHEAIEFLREKTQDWNQDNISNEIIDEFENLEKYIRRQAPHKNNPLYRLANISNYEGGNEDGD